MQLKSAPKSTKFCDVARVPKHIVLHCSLYHLTGTVEHADRNTGTSIRDTNRHVMVLNIQVDRAVLATIRWVPLAGNDAPTQTEKG